MPDIGPVSSLTARTAANLADADSFYLDDGAGADLRLTLLVLKQFLATATLAAGTLTVSSPFMLTQTWNDGGVTFRGKENVFTITAAAPGSTVERWLGGAAGATVLASLSSVGVLTLGDRLNVPALNGMTMSSSGPNYGNVLNIGANSWQMGFSSAQTTAGTAAITWTDNAGIILTPVNSLVQWMGTTAAFPAIGRVAVTGGWGLTLPSAANTNGQAVGFEAVTEETTIAAAATTDTAIQIPANVIVLGVSVRVTVSRPPRPSPLSARRLRQRSRPAPAFRRRPIRRMLAPRLARISIRPHKPSASRRTRSPATIPDGCVSPSTTSR